MKTAIIALTIACFLPLTSLAYTNTLLRIKAEQPKPNIPEHIDNYLKLKLGYSSTGSIEVIGKYHLTCETKLGAKDDEILHVIQKDLFGERLVWSCLVNTAQSKVQILYHCGNPDDFGEIKEIEKKNPNQRTHSITASGGSE